MPEMSRTSIGGVSRTAWSLVGTTKLKVAGRIGEFSIHKNILIVPYGDGYSGAVGFFHYPRGGASFAALGALQEPVDVTYSPAGVGHWGRP